jgi:hypothetical protein
MNPPSIDISWIDQEDEEGVIEKEPMDQIQCYYIYISDENEYEEERKIKHVIKETHVLEECPNHPEQRKISTGRLLQMIHSKKNIPQVTNTGKGTKNEENLQPKNSNEFGTKYRLMEILLYNVESEIDNIPNIDKTAMKIVTISEEIIIPPSLCIFHEINRLYFLFQEVEIDTYQPKPILKILSDISKGAKKTKKVAFKDQEFRHTKKRLSSPSPPTYSNK